jgi:DNA (cytosine-5)-methyltransferase 1
MQERQMEIKESNKTKKSIEVSDLARAFRSRSLEPNRNKGSGIGSNTKVAFIKLMSIAQTKDEMVNKAIGESLKNCKIIRDFKIEYPFKGLLDLKTDLFCITDNSENIRLEIMWRTKASRADIAIYVLNKLRNYGKAIGYLD